ncbi:MAG: acyl-CoA ligase (AMP-forming), exosortase A system-associated [Sphingomonadales bacterium]|nr:acyl-CoA ligase (AMP-forming), exosortase A system-associated [Sphingomonadales bacterium]MBK9002406.1 acyl-CoA ligase (AMP-forming), exosortase A system-associated [Sphingomonadales bacterium]MBK9267636.1 acyl-CoA ligase (AMP-forming), exosortase A system-associated [Sphingomonadales bacterium]MBP6435010.1 acyl-CoA ligase (AMP-forming), exosortase A system-associated [Sphingorhabdus sp.]
MTDDLPAFPLDHLALRGAPDAPALRIKDKVYSYQSLNHRIGRLAAILAAQDFTAGDRIATWLPKTELACLMPLAAVRAGLVHVPVNPLLKPAQVKHILSDSGAKALVTSAVRSDQLISYLEEEEYRHPELGSGSISPHDPVGAAEKWMLKQVQHDGVNCSVWEESEILTAIDQPGDVFPPLPVETDTDGLAAILYTSGSTGRPKGVMLSHANLALGAVSVARYLRLADDDVTLAVLPLSFDYGQNQLLSTWQAGGCVVPLDYLTPRDVLKACARYGVTTLAAVPPLWVQLAEQDWPEEATMAMRRLTNSGGALTPSLVKALRGIFGAKTDIYAMYGLTEAFRSTYLDPALIDANPTSMGKAIPYAEILVVAKDGSEAKPEEHGELVHAGPLVAQGYWKDAERTALRYKPAPTFSRYGGMAVWSGDTVWRDADGLLYFVGRDDAMIKTSGNRVSPTEVEEAAIESGLVAEACALGRKDERLGEAIVLFVRATGEADEAALAAHMKAALPNFMHPAAYVWLDTFPKNANGKLDRDGLKDRL